MSPDFHEREHEAISDRLAEGNALLLGLVERMARLETRVAIYSAIGGAAAGLFSSGLIAVIQLIHK